MEISVVNPVTADVLLKKENLTPKREAYEQECLPLVRREETADNFSYYLSSTERYLHRLRKDFHSSKLPLADDARSLQDIDTKLQHLDPTVEDNQPLINRRVAVEQRLRNFVLTNHDYYFRVVDRHQLADTQNQTPEQTREWFINQTINYLKQLTVPDVDEYAAVKSMSRQVADFGFSNFADYACLRDTVTFNSREQPRETLRQEMMKTKAEMELKLADPEMRHEHVRHWLRETVRASEKGEKIFHTPHFNKEFRRIRRLNDRENGVGGVILYGPPGTGKTEMAIALNAAEGFESRVVSMHYWAGFNTFLGEEPVPVGLDKVGNFLNRVKEARSRYEQMSGQEFMSTLQDLYDLKVEQGQIPAGLSATELIRQYTRGLSEGSTDADEIRKAHLRYLDVQIMSAGSLNENMEIDPSEFVLEGELDLAIKNNQRLIIDEADKAGPNTFPAISRLLAMSAGQSITFGNKELYIPSWFKINCTSNRTSLAPRRKGNENEGAPDLSYFMDRFDSIRMGYPPVPDELMIAAAWLADRNGTIKINAPEQIK